MIAATLLDCPTCLKGRACQLDRREYAGLRVTLCASSPRRRDLTDTVRYLSAAAIAAAGFLCATLSGKAQNNETVELLPEPSQIIQLHPGHSQEIRLKQPYRKVEITTPSVADVQPITDRDITLLAVQAGSTDIRFRDDKGAIVAQFVAWVWPPTTSHELIPTFEDIPGRVKVSLAAGHTEYYRCSDSGCEIVAEQPLTEAPPSHQGARPETPGGGTTTAPEKR
jgi:Flp pilus assembly secretin CpaC